MVVAWVIFVRVLMVKVGRRGLGRGVVGVGEKEFGGGVIGVERL